MRDILKATALMAVAATTLASIAEGHAAEVTTFSVTIRSVSNAATLALPGGKSTSAPIAPGLYAVLKGDAKLFAPDKAADGSLERLAEDGDASALLAAIRKMDGVAAADMFAPGLPLTVKAQPGDRLVFASMFVQSNDKFFAPDPKGIDLFKDRKPVSGDLTSTVVLWDAGTEEDEAPGAGPDQAPRQAGPDTGSDEHGVVRAANDGFTYPAVANVVQFTVLPEGTSPKSGS